MASYFLWGYSSNLKTEFHAREKSKQKLARCGFSQDTSSIRPSSGKKQEKTKETDK